MGLEKQFLVFLSGCLRQVLLYTSRGHRLDFPNYNVFQSLKIVFILANRAGPDEMQPSVASLFTKANVYGVSL